MRSDGLAGGSVATAPARRVSEASATKAGTRKDARELAFDAAALVLAAAIVATPALVPPCAHEILTASGATVPMRCHWTFEIVRVLGAAACLAALSLLVAGRGERRRVTGEALVALAALVVASTQPWVIGLCGRAEMACHTTAHWVWLWSALLAVAGVAARLSGRPAAATSVPPDPWERAYGETKAIG